MPRKHNLVDVQVGPAFVRIAGVSGIVFAVVILLANLLLVPAGLPSPGADLLDVVEFYGDDHGALEYVPSLLPFAWIGATVFGAGVVAVLWRSERERGEAWSLVGLAGLIMQNATFTVLIAARFTLGAVASDRVVTAGFWAFQDALLALNGTFLALALVGLSLAGLRARIIPFWHGAMGFVAAALQGTAAVMAPLVVAGESAWGLIGLVGWLIWVGWLVAYGMALLRLARSSAS